MVEVAVITEIERLLAMITEIERLQTKISAQAACISLRNQEIERLRSKVSELSTLLDEQMGTPCERIRHEQLRQALRVIWTELAYMDGARAHYLCTVAKHALGE